MTNDTMENWKKEKGPIGSEIIESAAIRHLHELDEGGTFGIIDQLLQMYREALPNRIKALEESAKKKDFKQVSRNAHAFKSPSAHLGMVRVVSLLQDIEDGKYKKANLEALIREVSIEAEKAQKILSEKNFDFCK
jgi:HPt (histidine-containing phosphotransfer) domain-containing protein